jgi:glycosyltransferase involved in cell wall biosynthesis
MTNNNHGPLKICLLSYRSNPHSGGQGVYLKNLSRALKDLGHQVQVISGPPDPCLDDDIPVLRLPCLDLYNPADPFRLPTLKELSKPINFIEWLGVSTMGFPEPFIFGIKAYRVMRNKFHKYDVVHDNQSLSYGLWAIDKFIPTIATIHHPITVDRKIAVQSVSAAWKKMKHMRWYSFLGMQKRVARTLSKIITVSGCAREDISRAFNIPKRKFRVVPNGIKTEVFRPKPQIIREKNRIIVTNSADIALKGLYYLLKAIGEISKNREVKLIVIGKPKKNGGIVKLVKELGIGPLITFSGRISEQE